MAYDGNVRISGRQTLHVFFGFSSNVLPFQLVKMRSGVRVIRGPDWCKGDEDGGMGFLGTVINIYPNNSVKVSFCCLFLLDSLYVYT